ncbi:MAG TPA: 2-hydroxychromene-2-carboxylate isomerase [Ramlibacter sp.]|jgi:2-hydroxychromene-2-carboxylate isomerase|uniref:2-hydroxychromene-2-carboxylate isomerase n=1 Tax=Ramlibacter sp. TaxID=1917967 RepID=UPI002D5DF534|nr:2-hydroxychromene-2-carboxylate isomerase [Ramlibacter sp.]HZY18789.1 2-hydroxychromene-2-carboxylate isomerase [Ramlibacter sp.]
MKRITFWFDVISPYAYLAFEQLPQALQGHSCSVEYRPVLFAGLLRHHGQLGPAEIPGKREWTYRQALWQAHAHGIPMQMPPTHPFNPLPLLRLALACGPNRHVCERVLRHVWRGGADAADPARLAALQAELAPAREPGSDEVKEALKDATTQAIAAGVFGVPTLVVDGRLFWGFDALPMLRAHLERDPWFDTAWDAGAQAAAVAVRPARG